MKMANKDLGILSLIKRLMIISFSSNGVHPMMAHISVHLNRPDLKRQIYAHDIPKDTVALK